MLLERENTLLFSGVSMSVFGTLIATDFFLFRNFLHGWDVGDKGGEKCPLLISECDDFREFARVFFRRPLSER